MHWLLSLPGTPLGSCIADMGGRARGFEAGAVAI